MPKKEKPLPKPPSAGGKARRFAEGEAASLMADRIAKAISEGRLEEFLEKEMPASEYAGKLVSMMMGMTGMLNPQMPGSESPRQEKPDAAQLPGDLREAVNAGDIKGVKEILRREHEKRSAGPEQTSDQAREDAQTGPSSLEKQLLDDLAKIAADNSVTLDWLIARALTLYVRDYSATGRL